MSELKPCPVESDLRQFGCLADQCITCPNRRAVDLEALAKAIETASKPFVGTLIKLQAYASGRVDAAAIVREWGKK